MEPIERTDTWTEYNEIAAHEWVALWPPARGPAPEISEVPFAFGSSAAFSSHVSDGALPVHSTTSSESFPAAQNICASSVPVRYVPGALEAITQERLERRARQDSVKPAPPEVASPTSADSPDTAASDTHSPTSAVERMAAAQPAAVLTATLAADSLNPVPVRLTEHPARGAPAKREERYASTDLTRRGQRRTMCRSPAAAAASMATSTEAVEPCLGTGDEELTRALEAGGQACEAALLALRGTVLHRSFAARGCRVVQLALKVAPPAVAAQLAAELRCRVRDGTASPYCNYVIQRVVELLPVESSAFVVAELLGKAANTARHRFGCRIMCRIFEHTAQTALTRRLAEELLIEMEGICRHVYGRHVARSLLEHGSDAQRHRIAWALRAQLPAGAKERNLSSVIDRALECLPDGDKAELAEILSRDAEEPAALAEGAHSALDALMGGRPRRQPRELRGRGDGRLRPGEGWRGGAVQDGASAA